MSVDIFADDPVIDPAPVHQPVQPIAKEPVWRRWLPTVLICLAAFLAVLWLSGRIPSPGPSPDPSPADDRGLHVLIVEETSDRDLLSDSQLEIITSTKLRSWLAANTVDEGGQPAYRIIDKDTDLSGESEVWQRLREKAGNTTPWLVASNAPHGGISGHIPPEMTVDALIERLKQLKEKE